MGPPGSGKGTQTDVLAEKLGLPAISPGELLRAEVGGKTAIGRQIEKILAGGRMVKNEIVWDLLEKRLAKKDAQKGVLFDGFPRNFKQTPYLSRLLENFNEEKYAILAFYIDISDREAKRRITGRRVCLCGRSYHIEIDPPKKAGICDACGQKLEHRADDRPQVVLRRLKIFHHENEPLLKFFSDHGVLVRIDGEQSIGRVRADIIRNLKKRGLMKVK